MRVIDLDQIRQALESVDVLEEVAAGFVAYSHGESVVPPVGELVLEDPPGDVHIKYGYLRGGETYVIKIASGFYDNPKRGLPSSNGLMLVFDRETGQPQAILLDEGYLTDVRTAAAGALAARHLAPSSVQRIGIVGAGIQARLQLEYLAQICDCRQVLAWGRSPDAMARYRDDMAAKGFDVEIACDSAEVAAGCDLIVTTTPSTEPLLRAADVRPGTHITAMGSDTPGKQELDAALLGRADRVVADSIVQCRERGEIAHALQAGLVREKDLVELGSVIVGDAVGRTAEDQITVADLTGVAVQDIQIATAVVGALG
ncbi:MAG: ornithine cyclodeaminase family protein [Acidobacteriota bacterium]